MNNTFCYFIRLFLYLLIAMVALKWPDVQPWVDDFCLLLATIVGTVLSFFDSEVTRHGNVIVRKTWGYALAVTKECSALETTATLLAAVLAFPTGLQNRLKTMLAFFILFQLANGIRLMALVYAQVLLSAPHFDVFHEQLCVLFLYFFSAGMFIYWGVKMKKLNITSTKFVL